MVMSLNSVTTVLNYMLVEKGKDKMSKTCTRDVIKRLKPLKYRVTKRSQGSTDKNSAWAKARYRWVK